MSLGHVSERDVLNQAIDACYGAAERHRITFRIRKDFNEYVAVRRAHGDIHLNQAFDPAFTNFDYLDFWVLGENFKSEAIVTYCVRHFKVADFYTLIRSQALWFGPRLRTVDPTFMLKYTIPPFGGQVTHGGGLWIRRDYRGYSGLAQIIPRFARSVAFLHWPADHDSAMIRNDPSDTPQLADRKAVFMGTRTYGFARVGRFVNGWFPPEERHAIMHLCHVTRAEALLTLSVTSQNIAPLRPIPVSGRVRLLTQEDGPRAAPSLRAAG